MGSSHSELRQLNAKGAPKFGASLTAALIADRGLEEMISYGVLCRKCGKHVHLAEARLRANEKVEHVPPREYIACTKCGYKSFYGVIDSHFEVVLSHRPDRSGGNGQPLSRKAEVGPSGPEQAGSDQHRRDDERSECA